MATNKKPLVTLIAREVDRGTGIAFGTDGVLVVNMNRYNKDLRQFSSNEPAILSGQLCVGTGHSAHVTVSKASAVLVRDAAVLEGLSPAAVEMAVEFARRNYTGTVSDLWLMAEAVAA